ncbi:FUSC family protein [Streptomyces sp. NPDC008150]|uniref:FUSC family protein n=1 Tax=Streptomyces sp. NPDC008150 TaxID=3364816 RepID=UPI0036E1B224
MLLNFSLSLRRALHFDRGWFHLRATAVSTATVLGTYGWSLLVEREAGLHVDSVVQAVVIASSLGRVQRAFDRTDRLIACVVLPCAAAGGTELSTLIQHHPDPGDALFTLGVAGSLWVRRFGTRAVRAGTLVVLPLVAVLVVPGGIAPAGGHERTGWAAVTALFALAWGSAVTWAACRAGVVRRPPSVTVAAMPGTNRPGIAASTRMACQAATALAAAFAVGRALWPDHWPWVVLTAFLVASGARSRGDVLVKGVWRTVGASAGTVVAGVVAGSFGPRSDTVVVVIFAVLAVATWLRELSYAYWAGCVTAVLSLLYDWFGQSSGSLLHTRLAGIAVGAVLGISASWLVLPVRTSATVRSRTAAALAGLGELLTADGHDVRAVRTARARFAHRVDQLTLAAAPLKVLEQVPAPRRVAALWRRPLEGLLPPAALRRCAAPADALASATLRAPDALAADAATVRHRSDVATHALAVRRAIGRRPAPEPAPEQPPLTPAEGPHPAETVTVRAALDAIDAQLDVLTELFGTPPNAPAGPAADTTSPTAEAAR